MKVSICFGGVNYGQACHYKGCAYLYTHSTHLQSDLDTGLETSMLPKLFKVSKLQNPI